MALSMSNQFSYLTFDPFWSI